MDKELDKILGEEEKETPKAPLEPEKNADDELQKKQQQKSNLEKAIAEAKAELKSIREEKKKTKPTEEEVPKIDFADPSSKAWDKHIKETVEPYQRDQDKVKGEIFNYAFSKWIEDKPALRDNPEDLKAFMGDYEKVRQSTGLTREGVELDLDRAFAVKYAPQLIERARGNRAQKVKDDQLFAEAAISRGATSYQEETETIPSDNLSKEEKDAVVRMYGSLDAYNAMMKKSA